MFYSLQIIIIFLAHSFVIGDQTEKDVNVYLAKLAEHAKRYDGNMLFHFCFQKVFVSTWDG